MSGIQKNIRELLAGKELIGFKKSSGGNRPVERASSAKVTVIKAPKSDNGAPVLQRSITAKVGAVKGPRSSGTK